MVVIVTKSISSHPGKCKSCLGTTASNSDMAAAFHALHDEGARHIMLHI